MRFDIAAKAEGRPSPADMHVMLRNLLIDRFKLRTHVESREMPVYALVVDRNAGAPSLKRSEGECSRVPSAGQQLCEYNVRWGA